MVHTLAPWTSKWRMAKIFGQIDSGEVAARLGGLSLFDRRGQTFWYDDFEAATLDWYGKGVGVGAAVNLNAAKHYLGSQSVKLTTGNATDNSYGIYKQFHMPSDSKIGFEAMLDFGAADITVSFNMTIYDGTNKNASGLRFDTSDNSIEYKDSNLNLVSLGTMNWSGVTYRQWIPVKLVIDYATRYYVRAIIGDTEYDMSTYALHSTADAGVKNLQISITNTTQSDNSRDLNVDNVIITQNEP